MAKVIGYRYFDYTSRKTGRTYPAVTVYLVEDLANGVGQSCFDVFMPSDRLGGYQPALNDEVRIMYNRYGSVESIVKDF